jgi:serine/threonine-protein kinase
VVLTVSLGAETFTMPSLIGKSVTEAENILLKNGLVPKEDVKKEPSYFDEGIVFDQWPVKAGEKVSKGMEITLYVSSGLKPDAVKYDVFIPILTNNNKESQISIRITDARYTDYEIVSKKVSGFEEIPIHFVLAPGHDASYVVIQDGVQTSSDTITYNEIVGGD